MEINTIDEREHGVKENVTIVVKNKLNKSIWYHDWWEETTCMGSFSLGRKNHGEYDKFYSIGTQECRTEITKLGPNSTIEYQLKIGDLKKWSNTWNVKFQGTYRLKFNYELSKEGFKEELRRTSHSNEFTVKDLRL